MGNNKSALKNILNFIIGISGIFLAYSAIFTITQYILPPQSSEMDISRVTAAKIGELSPNSAKIFRFGNKPGILINTVGGVLKAFNAVCTHLNCTVQYSAKTYNIWCACHNGKFDLNGKVISGPPPKPLEEYKVTVEGGNIVVSRF